YRSYEELEIKDNGNAILQSNGEEIKPAVEKMSKSKKNVINPDDILNKYGADAFRMYEMFMGPLEDSKPWDMKGIEGVHRFLKRAWGWGVKAIQQLQDTSHKSPASAEVSADRQVTDREIEILRHETIKKVTQDLEAMKFNTAISALMIYLNKLIEGGNASQEDLTVFLKLLHPFAPHITDELWDMKGGKTSLIKEQWPQTDMNVLSERKVEIPIQINGKVKARIYVTEKTPSEELEKLALKETEKLTSGNAIKKIIVVPGRLVSIVTGGNNK
ncbi:MAG: class I tRNA ligase family protein, partial [Elusimicrobia bacterium]|nr:class I tRNA ligase family protein [Elusimicrobiota bacterium]